MNVTKWNGKSITKPGWYSGISLDDYHGPRICKGPAVSSSDLRTCWAKSPAHMYAEWSENPKREPRKSTRAMVLGSASHHILLGEDHFKLRFVHQPATYRDKVSAREKEWHNGARYCQQWHERQKDAGRTVVTLTELATIVAMSRSLALEPIVNAGLLRGHVELSGFWQDGETGLWVKVRPDVIPIGSGDFVDLKTANDVTTPSLQSAIRSRGYHQQGALVWQASEVLLPDVEFATFVLLFVESSPPHCARAVPITDEDLARGRMQNRAMMRKIASCLAGNHWPGPGEGDIRPLPLSTDERARIDARLKFEGVS